MRLFTLGIMITENRRLGTSLVAILSWFPTSVIEQQFF